jgi:anti-sigma regulatory factor (Ser/Thr protein kinase)
LKKIEVSILNRREDMLVVANMVEHFGAENRIALPVLHDVNVVLDEILNNIVAYGYEAGAQSEIAIRLEYRPDVAVIMTIEDRGRPFDPLELPAPDLSEALRHRKVGGLGVHFVRRLMDDVRYARIGDMNLLTLTKKLARNSE